MSVPRRRLEVHRIRHPPSPAPDEAVSLEDLNDLLAHIALRAELVRRRVEVHGQAEGVGREQLGSALPSGLEAAAEPPDVLVPDPLVLQGAEDGLPTVSAARVDPYP